MVDRVFGPSVSPGVPIAAGSTVKFRVRQASGSAQTLSNVRFGIMQVEPQGQGLVALPSTGDDGGGWEPVDTQVMALGRRVSPEVQQYSAVAGAPLWDADPAPSNGSNPYAQVDVHGNVFFSTRSDLYKYDPDGILLWQAPTSTSTFQIVVDKEGTRIWGVSSAGVHMYDGADGSELAYSGTLPTFGWSIAVNSAGEVVFGGGDGTTRKLNPDLSVQWTYSNANQGARIGGVAIDPLTGDVYAAGWKTSSIGAVNKISSDGSATLWSNEDVGTQSYDLALTADALYHSGASSTVLRRLNTDTGAQEWQTTNGGCAPVSLAVDPDGFVYTTGTGTSSSNRGARKIDGSDGTEIFRINVTSADGIAVLPGEYDVS